MKSYTELWQIVKEVAQDEGCTLFDLELSGSTKRRIVRVYIASTTKESAITVEQCAKVNKRLNHLFEVDGEFLGEYLLEVSSPGINRKLRLPDHFQGAVGERIKVMVNDPAVPGRVVRGVLTAFDGEQLCIEDELAKHKRMFVLSQVDHAHVDFPFDH